MQATPSAARRDLRLDFFWGLAIAVVVVDHMAWWRPASYLLYHLLTIERVGALTGTEFFVLLSGLVLGMVHRRRIATQGWAPQQRVSSTVPSNTITIGRR